MGNVRTFECDASGNRIRALVEGELVDVSGATDNVRLAESRWQYDAMTEQPPAVPARAYRTDRRRHRGHPAPLPTPPTNHSRTPRDRGGVPRAYLTEGAFISVRYGASDFCSSCPSSCCGQAKKPRRWYSPK